MKAFATRYEGKQVTARRLNEGSWPYTYELRDTVTNRRRRVVTTTHLPNDPDEAKGK